MLKRVFGLVLSVLIIQAATVSAGSSPVSSPKIRVQPQQNPAPADTRRSRRAYDISKNLLQQSPAAKLPNAVKQSKRKSHSGSTPVYTARKKNKVLTSQGLGLKESQEYLVVQFSNANTTDRRSALETKLALVSKDSIRLAKPGDIKSVDSGCNQLPCAVVSPKQFQILQSSGISFQSVGKRVIQVQPKSRPANLDFSTKSYCGSTPSELKANVLQKQQCSKNGSGAKSYKSGPTGGNSPQSFFSNTNFTVYNPDPFTYYIPDYGYQELGDYFPNPSILGPTAVITSVDYTVGVSHDYMSDLDIEIGYDDTSLGGTSALSQNIWNNFSSGSTYTTLTGTTHAFDGYYPDSYYYVGAWDTVAQDIGYLDYVQFDVWFQVDPDLKMFSGSGSYNIANLNLNQYLDVNLSTQNDSAADAGAFDVAWYLAPEPFGGCSNLNTFNTSTNYFVGYQSNANLYAGYYVNNGLSAVDLANVTNLNGTYLTSGATYCIWANIDDLNDVYESDEYNNVLVYSPAITYVAPPPPVPNLISIAGTYNTDPFTNMLSANAQVHENNGYAGTSSTFSIGWYISPKPPTGCSLSTLNLTPSSINNAYFAGYQNVNGISPYGYANTSIASVNLQSVLNPQGGVMAAGQYCLWAYVDDTLVVNEGTNGGLDNFTVYSTPFSYAPIPTNLTFLGGGTMTPSNYFYISAQNTIKNDTVTSTSATFNVSWYLTATSGGCGSIIYNTQTAYLAGTQAVNGLLANSTQSVYLNGADLRTAQNSLGQSMPEGTYCVWAKVDSGSVVAEGNEVDNFYYSYSNNPITYNLPNLYVESATAPSVTPTFQLSTTATIRNGSNFVPATGNFAVNFFLTPEIGSCGSGGPLNVATAFNAGGVILNGLGIASTTQAALSSANLNTIQNTLNQTLSNGYYCVWAYVDSLSQVVESNEADNAYEYVLQGHVYFERSDLTVDPDLAVTNVTVNPIDETLTVQTQIQNQSALAGVNNNFNVNWFAKKLTNGTTCTGGTYTVGNSWLLSSQTVPAIGAATALPLTVPTIDPYTAVNSSGQYMTAGQYCLWISVDTANTITENNEGNNIFAIADPFSITLQTGEGPDLVPTDVTGVGQPVPLPTITNSFFLNAVGGVVNNGNADTTTSSAAKWYISTKPTNLGCDTLQGSALPNNAWPVSALSPVVPLAVGGVSAIQIANLDLRVPVNGQNQHIPSGSYCLWIEADSGHVVHEGNENNNINVLPNGFTYVDVTGVEDLSTPLKLSLYPNPASDQVQIQIPESAQNQNAMLFLYAINGQEIQRANVTSSLITFDLTSLSVGTYIVTLRAKNGTTSTRLEKR